MIDHLQLRGVRGWTWWSTPNAAKRSLHLGADLKRQGMTPGVGDLSLIDPDNVYHELELKTESGRLSPAQRARLEMLRARGVRVAVGYGLDSALAILTSWGALR